MTDLHIHTKFSPDSSEEPENYIDEAIKARAKIIGFSEHIDFDYLALKLKFKPTDIHKYFDYISQLKKLNKDKIKILCGAEYGFCQLSLAKEKYLELEESLAFDYIINSVHIVDGKESYFLPYFKDKTKQFSYDRYFETVLQSLYADYDYQIIGHFGYVSRNAPYENAKILLNEHNTIIDEILKTIINLNKTLEINTNVKTAGTYTLPSMEIVNRYFELGGKLICFGSDAHRLCHLLYNYDMAIEDLKKIGFTETVYYENKKLKFIGI